jgi:hypothetical protein
MKTSQRMRGVNARIRREAVHMAGLAPSAELVKTVARDDNVRAATRDVLSRAGKLRGELNSQSDRIGRLARDPGLQSDVAALIRSTAGALDATVAAGRRRARRRVFRSMLLVGSVAVAIAAWAKQRNTGAEAWNDSDETSFADRTATLQPDQPTSNGVATAPPATTEPTSDGQSKPTPAEAAAQADAPHH